MRVIGISPLDKDATASFMEDGHVVFACGEERLSRVKLQDGFPQRAMMLGFEYTGWDPSSIDAVGYAFFDGTTEGKLIHKALQKDREIHSLRSTATSLARLREIKRRGYQPDFSSDIPGFTSRSDEFMPPKAWYKSVIYGLAGKSAVCDCLMHRHFFRQWASSATADHLLRTRQLQAGLKEFGLDGKLARFNHHDTHAANSFYASGFDEALLITLDGYGSGNCGGIYVGNRDGIQPLHKFAFPNSLGQYYEMVTSALGFRPGRHEGKIVGLAAYGNAKLLAPVLRERFVCSDGDILIRAGINYFFTRALAQGFAKRDVAAVYQFVLEQVTQEMCRYWINKTGLRNVAVSGGVNANVKLNQRIREIDGVDRIFVYPNMGDGGCGTGAAMLLFDKAGIPNKAIENAYYGPDYSEAQLEKALQAAGLVYDKPVNIEDKIAELLSQDHIIGRFDGRMEYGPRALGNRSVLYPALDPDVNLWLNHQLGRTEFMPFAPAALSSEAHRLFKNVNGCEKTAEFMTITFDCTDEMCRHSPAAVHVDKTARPQLVSAQTNPSFYRIITAYNERTGIPAIINTSFNLHEEPIVCSPEDAVRAFLSGNIDYLAMGSFLVPHPRLESLRQQRKGMRVSGDVRTPAVGP